MENWETEPTYLYMGAEHYAAWSGSDADRTALRSAMETLIAGEGLRGTIHVMTPYDDFAFSVEASYNQLVIDTSEDGRGWHEQLQALDARLESLLAQEVTLARTHTQERGF